LTETTSRSDTYLQWRARLAAKQQEVRTQTDEPPKPKPNPMWDPSRLYVFKRPAPSPEAPTVAPPRSGGTSHEDIDLRTPPIDLRTPVDQAPERAADASPHPRPVAVQSRRLALVARYAPSQGRTSRPPEIAAALRDLNERRVAGTISEDEFKAKQAALFA
jgi:hypothetical protein